MKRTSLIILVASALFLAGASGNPRPNKHKEQPKKHADGVESAAPIPTPPMVPLAAYEAAHSSLVEALRALHAEQEARAKDKNPTYEPIYSPSVLIQAALLVVGFFYTLYARRQLRAIHRQADIADATLTETSRPWVYPELTVVEGGLRYTNGVARIVLRVTLKNTGRSVAVDTRIYMKMLFYIGGEHPVDKQLEFIEAIRTGPQDPRPYGIALFPDETNTLRDQELLVGRDEIERCKRGPNGAIHPTIVGFVQYRFAFPSKVAVHETRFIYEMARRTGDMMTTPNAYTDIPSEELAFFPSFNGGHEVT